jgi:threonine dehydrogenase-like Zn-dependent dehydrogenase
MTCGRCRFCRQGRENICENLLMLGNHLDGAYAEYVAVPAKDVLKLPDDLPLVDSCVIADAVSTPFHAVTVRGGVRPGQVVVVVGCGGIGLNIIQIAAAVGATVLAVDRSTRRLERAREFGAVETLNPLETDRPDKQLRRLSGGGADVAFEAVGTAATQRLACDSLRKGGRLVLVGYSAEDMMLPAARVMYHELEVVGSLGCRPADYPALFELVRRGRVRLDRVVTARLPLEEINAGFDLVRRAEGVRTIVVL